MNKETREQVSLARYKLISPVLAEPGRNQNEYFRNLEQREHLMPHYGVRRYRLSTFKAWLRAYRKKGLSGLEPKKRADMGRPRHLGEADMNAIQARCKAFPKHSVIMLHQQLLDDNQLGDPPICYSNLLRIIRQHNWLPKLGRTDTRKRYEHSAINELWVGDFMHGPVVKTDKRRAKAILCAIIDDHSRMIVGHRFAAAETVASLTVVLKDAFEAFGMPKRLYVDNGPSFSSDLLAKTCAQGGISLIHSKPYDSPSRGKIERFFRTVRARFLVNCPREPSLVELNDDFTAWLREDYRHKHHAGIDARPIDRYQASAGKVQIRRMTRDELNEIFLVRHERVVNNDATISFKGNIYEVPAAYIRQRIEIRHPVDNQDDLLLYDNGSRVTKIKLVNPKENAQIFRPSKNEASIRFAAKAVPQGVKEEAGS